MCFKRKHISKISTMNTVQFSLRNQALFDNINACCNDVYMNPLVFHYEQPETGTL